MMVLLEDQIVMSVRFDRYGEMISEAQHTPSC
jgi:hypothetical protein